MIGAGDATFAHAYPATGSSPGGVAVADINGDGILDIVKAGEVGLNGGMVSVLLGTAAHGFTPKAEYSISLGPGSLALADVNGDGKLDVVTAANTVQAASNPAVSVLLGNGDGTYGGELKFTPASRFSSMATADLDGDHKADIVATTEAGTVSVLLAKGDGTFASPVDYTAGQTPVSVAVGDVNGDGTLDIVVTNSGLVAGYDTNPSVTVLLGTGGGAFATGENYPVGYTRYSYWIALGDLNHDGKLDFVLANGDAPNGLVTVWLGNGDGTFIAKGDYPAAWNAGSPVLADVNNDGNLDVIVNNNPGNAPGEDSVSVLLGNGDGSLGTNIDYPIEAESIAVGDLNGDGRVDLAVSTIWSNTVDVLLNSYVVP